AAALGAETLVILSNVPGLLAAFPDERSLVRHVPVERLDWAEELAAGRMKRKILAAREALAGGVSSVIIADARAPNPVQHALAGAGTWLGATPPAVHPIPDEAAYA
ncbi:MAG: hypothetical protein RMN24_15425, partial [Anaerolineae bacterium]|nr:hypothetical protein [Caldilineales bacterium]MDW8270548.1 hypothetical protein [Anaerolineae bacterium]